MHTNPAFPLVAVITLALGIGANAAILSLINAVILSTLPVNRPAELVAVGDPAIANSHNIGTPSTANFSYPLYRVLRDQNSVFSGMTASGNVPHTQANTSTPVPVHPQSTQFL